MDSAFRRILPAAAAILGAWATALPAGAQDGDSIYDAYRSRPTVTIGGTVRDFVPMDQPGGHADFGRVALTSVGRYVHMAANTLDAEGKPVFNSRGRRVQADWRDAAGRTIIPTRTYIDPRPGDVAGSTNEGDGASASAASTFAQWFRTTPGVNVASATTVTFTHSPGAQSYIFDGTLDDFRGSGSPDYSYSFETDFPFIYERGHDWWLSVRTNGDALVFIDDRLVIDNGGGMGARPALAVEETILVRDSFVVGADANSPLTVSCNSGDAAAIRIENSGQVAGDVLVGPGGTPASGIMTSRPDSISGITGTLGNGVTIGVASVPAGMPISSGNIDIEADATLSGNLHCGNLTIRKSSVVMVTGTCRVLCDGAFTIRDGSQILLSAGARLEVYAQGAVTIRDQSAVNRSGDPDRLILACMGAGGISVLAQSEAWGHLVCAAGDVEILDRSNVHGSVAARSARLIADAQLTGMGDGFRAASSACSAMGEQRIQLDRLAWLDETRTHTLRFFYANRTNQASPLRLETNMLLVRIAALPPVAVGD